ncbi:MAG: putative rane protein [Chlamydiia bacterium]|nr:putative rane protein [Chlamydiia bacterium]
MMQEPEREPPHGASENFLQFLMNNKRDAIAYIILFLGLLCSLFGYSIGGLVVGFILGLYFSKETRERISAFKEYLVLEGIFRGFVLVAAALALLIASPGLCVGTVAGAFIRPYLGEKK